MCQNLVQFFLFVTVFLACCHFKLFRAAAMCNLKYLRGRSHTKELMLGRVAGLGCDHSVQVRTSRNDV